MGVRGLWWARLPRVLSTETPEELCDRAELVVPLRRRNSVMVADDDLRAHIVVLLNVEEPQRSVPSNAEHGRSKVATTRHGEKAAQHRSSLHPPTAYGIDPSQLPDAYDPATGSGRWRYGPRLGEGGLGIVYRAGAVTWKISCRSADTEAPQPRTHRHRLSQDRSH